MRGKGRNRFAWREEKSRSSADVESKGLLRSTFRRRTASFNWNKGSELDEATIRDFLATTYPRLVAGLTLAFGSRPAAEDAVQEALARAWERSERGERIESLVAWVTVVATNLMRSGLRRLWAERRAGHRLERAGGGSAQEPTARVNDLIDLRRAVAALPGRQRAAVVLRYYLDLDVAHVARALKVGEGTAKTTLHRARRSLAAALGEPSRLGEPNREEARDVAGH